MPLPLNVAMKAPRTVEHNLKIKEALLKNGRTSKETKKCPKCQQILNRILFFRQKKNRTGSYCFGCEKQDGAERFAKKQLGKITQPRRKKKSLIVSHEKLISNSDGNHDPDKCWNWMKSKNTKGYGKTRSEGRLHYVHRLSWEFTNGKIADGLLVLHKCDNPSCINPNHLFLGTHKDNINDMMNKGRNNQPTGDLHGSKTKPESIARGIKVSTSKLNDDLVLEIRKLKKSSNSSNYVIARHYGVSAPTIRAVVNGVSWSHVS